MTPLTTKFFINIIPNTFTALYFLNSLAEMINNDNYYYYY